MMALARTSTDYNTAIHRCFFKFKYKYIAHNASKIQYVEMFDHSSIETTSLATSTATY